MVGKVNRHSEQTEKIMWYALAFFAGLAVGMFAMSLLAMAKLNDEETSRMASEALRNVDLSLVE